jgi:hypothetical protein
VSAKTARCSSTSPKQDALAYFSACTACDRWEQTDVGVEVTPSRLIELDRAVSSLSVVWLGVATAGPSREGSPGPAEWWRRAHVGAGPSSRVGGCQPAAVPEGPVPRLLGHQSPARPTLTFRCLADRVTRGRRAARTSRGASAHRRVLLRGRPRSLPGFEVRRCRH